MRISWDEHKREKNLAKHRMDFALVTEEVLASALIFPARQGRYTAIATVDGRLVSVIIKRLGTEGISIISLRPASEKERRML